MSAIKRLPQKIAVLNFGGIGDEVLFSPVLDALKQALPDSRITMIMEKRSAGIAPLLPRMAFSGTHHSDTLITVDLAEFSREKLFFQLRHYLTMQKYDAVLSSGSSPFIAPMLFSTGIPYRVGYGSKSWSKFFLSKPAPLNTQQYASQMYFALAQTFIEGLYEQGLFTQQQYEQLHIHRHGHPVLARPHLEDEQWAETMLTEFRMDGRKVVLIHPGVSLMSIQKNILKSWPASHWAQFIQEITQAHPKITFVLLGGPDDEATITAIRGALNGQAPPNFYDWYGKTKSLGQLAALIANVDMLLSADSAPLHIAVGYQKPVVAMFGPTDERKLLPPEGHYHAVTVENLACRPCLWDRRMVSCDNPVCLDVPVPLMRQAFEKALTTL